MEVIALVKSNNPNETRSLRIQAGIFTKIGTVAPETVANAVQKLVAVNNGDFGDDSLAGDIWWKVENVRIKEDSTPRTGFMAERHKGVNYLTVTLINEEPEPTPQFPTSFILENPDDGSRAEYQFVKVVE